MRLVRNNNPLQFIGHWKSRLSVTCGEALHVDTSIRIRDQLTVEKNAVNYIKKNDKIKANGVTLG